LKAQPVTGDRAKPVCSPRERPPRLPIFQLDLRPIWASAL